MIYCRIENGQVVDRATFDGPMPDGWGTAGDVWVASEDAQIGWSFANNTFTAPLEPEPPPVDLTKYAADKRWRVETGGITVAGAAIPTSREDQAMITGAVAFAQLNPDASIQFKAVSGWVTLTATQMVGIGLSVGTHVQACFAAEAAIDADVDGGTITTAEQIEADGRWPG